MKGGDNKASTVFPKGCLGIKFVLTLGTFYFMNFQLCAAQKPDRIAVKNMLQGAWMMDADTNAVLIFTNDTITLRMRRTAGKGNGAYIITSTNCNPGRFAGDSALYINETYMYMQYGMQYSAMLCYKILAISPAHLKLQKEDITETYTKFDTIPKFK
jgi:hypothetical protein